VAKCDRNIVCHDKSGNAQDSHISYIISPSKRDRKKRSQRESHLRHTELSAAHSPSKFHFQPPGFRILMNEVAV
jgi:hypothetical protein